MAPAIASNTKVDIEALLEFVRPRHHMLLITRRADGAPQASPVSGGVDSRGRIVVSSYPDRAKSVNLRRDAHASVLVLSDDWDGPWVQLDGRGEVIEPSDAVEPLVEYYRSIAGEHPDWSEYREAMQKQGKCLIRITVERWGPVATGGFPAHLVG